MEGVFQRGRTALPSSVAWASTPPDQHGLVERLQMAGADGGWCPENRRVRHMLIGYARVSNSADGWSLGQPSAVRDTDGVG